MPRATPSETLIHNLLFLLQETGMTREQLAKSSGVSLRMIAYILSGERTATVETAEKLAKPFRITGWQLILPDLPYTLATSGRLEKLIQHYCKASQNGRDYIDRVAEQESKYANENDA